MTLVPSVVRRDPLRLPPYCVRQRHPRTVNVTSAIETETEEHQPLSTSSVATNKPHSSTRNSPDFFIRGFVIGGQKLKAEPSIDDQYQPIDSRPQRQRFCDDVWRRRSRKGEAFHGETDDEGDDDDNDDIEQCLDSVRVDALLTMNMDGYEMDRFGHLPGNSRTPSPMHRRGWTPDETDAIEERMSARRPLRTNTAPPRISSPTTEQIIRIELNK